MPQPRSGTLRQRLSRHILQGPSAGLENIFAASASIPALQARRLQQFFSQHAPAQHMQFDLVRHSICCIGCIDNMHAYTCRMCLCLRLTGTRCITTRPGVFIQFELPVQPSAMPARPVRTASARSAAETAPAPTLRKWMAAGAAARKMLTAAASSWLLVVTPAVTPVALTALQL